VVDGRREISGVGSDAWLFEFLLVFSGNFHQIDFCCSDPIERRKAAKAAKVFRVLTGAESGAMYPEYLLGLPARR